jgi:hypothetical protein
MVVTPDWRSFDEAIPSGLAFDNEDSVYIGLRAGASVDARENGGTDLLLIEPSGDTISRLKLPQVAEIHAMTRRGEVLNVTDRGSHSVQRYDLRGQLGGVIGSPDHPSDTGCTEPGGEVPRAAGPFNRPTNAVEAADGQFFVTDGYGNARIHAFDASYRLLRSWGSYGSAAGEVKLPHSLMLDDSGRVLVCDRNNSRIQMFTTEGTPLGDWWTTYWPADIIAWEDSIFVVDLTPQVTELDKSGRVIRQWAVPPSAHNIAVDSHGNIYVCHIQIRSVTKITRS